MASASAIQARVLARKDPHAERPRRRKKTRTAEAARQWGACSRRSSLQSAKFQFPVIGLVQCKIRALHGATSLALKVNPPHWPCGNRDGKSNDMREGGAARGIQLHWMRE